MNSLHLSLSYVMPDQAQKHVPVNESLRMLDDLLHATVEQTNARTPPESPTDGVRYLLGKNPVGAWQGHGAQLVTRQDGAWLFYTPKPGWRLWDKAQAQLLVYDGASWQLAGPALADKVLHMDDIDHSLIRGATNRIADAIPAQSLVLGAGLRITQAIGGATSWSLGVARASARYGTALKTSLNTTHMAQSMQFYATKSPLILSATAGSFDGTGRVRLRLYRLTLAPPAA